MYLKKTPSSNGRVRLSIVDSYYDKQKKCSRQTTIESLGFLDELQDKYEDPIAFFHYVSKNFKKMTHSQKIQGWVRIKCQNRL